MPDSYIYVNYIYFSQQYFMHRYFNVFKLLIDYLPLTCLYHQTNDNNETYKHSKWPSDKCCYIYILDTHSTNDCIHNFGLNFLFELSYPIGILYIIQNSKSKILIKYLNVIMVLEDYLWFMPYGLPDVYIFICKKLDEK